jgi:uncharacterized membrane protein YtjA (UPF0391 family)
MFIVSTVTTLTGSKQPQGFAYQKIFKEGVKTMLKWTIILLVVAIIAAILGFAGLAGAAANLARILFWVFLVLFILSLLFGRRRL